jgi:hypothetical protein
MRSLAPRPTPNLEAPGTTLRLAWLTLPGAYAPTSIPVRVTGAREPPLHGKAAVREEVDNLITSRNIFQLCRM